MEDPGEKRVVSTNLEGGDTGGETEVQSRLQTGVAAEQGAQDEGGQSKAKDERDGKDGKDTGTNQGEAERGPRNQIKPLNRENPTPNGSPAVAVAAEEDRGPKMEDGKGKAEGGIESHGQDARATTKPKAELSEEEAYNLWFRRLHYKEPQEWETWPTGPVELTPEQQKIEEENRQWRIRNHFE